MLHGVFWIIDTVEILSLRVILFDPLLELSFECHYALKLWLIVFLWIRSSGINHWESKIMQILEIA